MLHTNVRIGKVNLGLLNRIIVDDMLVDDQSGKQLLKVTRLSAKFDLKSILEGKISINSVQLFGFTAQLNKQTPQSASNFKFVIDAFAPKDTIKTESNINLRINSILIRRGKVSYDVLSEEETPGIFNPNHLEVHNIIANLSLKALTPDSLNMGIKRLSFDEQSGFSLKKLKLKLIANRKEAQIEHFTIDFPESSIQMGNISLMYSAPDAFEHIADKVAFSMRILPTSYVTLKDISPFVPTLKNFKEPIWLDLQARGTINQLSCPRFALSTEDRTFSLSAEGSGQNLTHPEEAYIFGKLSELNISRRGTGFLVRNLSHNYNGTPPMLEHLGDISFRGEVSGYFTDLVTYGILRTDVGTIRTDLKLTIQKGKKILGYSGAIKSEHLNLGLLTGNNKLGIASFNFDLNGTYSDAATIASEVKGQLSAIDYNHYTYENITVDGKYSPKGFEGKLNMDDPNGQLAINGSIDLAARTPIVKLTAQLSNIRPYQLKLTPDYKDTEVSLSLKADFRGDKPDNLVGEVNIDSLQFQSPEKNYFMNNFVLKTYKDAEGNHLKVNSDFMTADLNGNFRYHTLPASIMKVVQHYLPSLISPSKNKAVETNNAFTFKIKVLNTDLLNTVFKIPVTLYSPSALEGYFYEKTEQLRIEGYCPQLQYKNDFIESGMFTLDNSSDCLHSKVRFTTLKKEDAINYALDVKAKEDKISTIVNWGNNSSVTYSGKLDAIIQFLKTADEKPVLKTEVDIRPTTIILNDSVWNLNPSRITLESGNISIDNFLFNNHDRYIRINGRISKSDQDTVKVDLKKINVKYVFDIVKISDDIHFSGDATGTAYASGMLKAPTMETKLRVTDFALNNGRFGDLNIYGMWDNEKRGILLNGHIEDGESYQSDVVGYIFPLKPESGLDLHITAGGLNIKFLEKYLSSIAKDIEGRGTGKVHLYGKFNALNLDGQVKTDASMRFDILNTRFGIKDTIHLAPTGLTFNNAKIEDAEKHEGILNGYLHFKHFKDMKYFFEVQTKNMLVMNTKESTDLPFYGTMYGTGNAVLSGNATQGLDVNIAMTTNRNSTFTYINSSVASATNSQFIRFVDKTPKRILQDTLSTPFYYDKFREKAQAKEDDGFTSDIRLNILVDATPDATMKILMDPIAGDNITAKGYGNIRTEFYNKGDIKMFGNYQITQGVYKFSLQEVIRKDFQIREGSSIMFNGAPLEAILNIKASHTVNSASLNDLIPEASTFIQQPNVRVNCIMDLTGLLPHPSIKLGIELPNERDEIQTLVRNYISTDEQMNMQILYLLGIGKFYTDNSINKTQNSNLMPSVISSTLSGQLNNALSQILNSNTWNFGTNLSTGEKGWTDVEVQGILSGQLLNNRLLINGNFGYRDNPLANTNFVGDFQAEWLMTRSGDFRLKAYNETNDRYYTKTNLTTQGIGIIYKKDFNKWSDLFFWNNWKIRNKQRREAKQKKEKENKVEPSK